MRIRRKEHSVPRLAMMAMPDLIFTILFFFMIVTHLRESTPSVPLTTPAGTNLQKVKKNAAVIDVFVGKNTATGEYEVQVNNTHVGMNKLPYALRCAKEESAVYREDQIIASLQADRCTPMYIINNVKKALREAQILKVNYSGVETADPSSLPQE